MPTAETYGASRSAVENPFLRPGTSHTMCAHAGTRSRRTSHTKVGAVGETLPELKSHALETIGRFDARRPPIHDAEPTNAHR